MQPTTDLASPDPSDHHGEDDAPGPRPDVDSHIPELRRRAQHLVAFAARIERSLVVALDDLAEPEAVGDDDDPDRSARVRLCDELLRCNLHHLHRAADDLRVTAMRFRCCADDLEATIASAA